MNMAVGTSLGLLALSLSGTAALCADDSSKVLKRPEFLAHYSGKDSNDPNGPGVGVMECGSLSTTRMHFEKVKAVDVYFYKELPKRIWIHIDGGETGDGAIRSGDYLLGEDESCWFRMTRSTQLP
ncbi:MAG: hypothetical protein J0H11_15110 [Rhizobiales bacterium]|nr:hypothetical protein [Hyphomicrobiales bacterium]